jgi:Mce-associated membrane protein
VLIGGLAAAALIAGAVAAGVLTHDLASSKSRLEHSLSPSAQSAIATAKTYAIDFATYTYSDLDTAFAKTESHSVDPFLSQYRNETAQLRATLRKAKASSSATVDSAGIASLTADTAVVDLFLDQTITNSSGTHVDAQRVEMTLQRQHDTWLISKVVLP